MLEELRNKSAAELQTELVTAKKELFNLKIPKCYESIG
jgi:ribosomal protein L29